MGRAANIIGGRGARTRPIRARPTSAIFNRKLSSLITRFDTNARSSAIVVHKGGGVVYLSGQVAADSSEGIEEQTKSTLARVDALLEQAGTSKERILSATIYLRDIERDFAHMNGVWNDWVPVGHAPARACVEARMARASLLVEVTVEAAQ